MTPNHHTSGIVKPSRAPLTMYGPKKNVMANWGGRTELQGVAPREAFMIILTLDLQHIPTKIGIKGSVSINCFGGSIKAMGQHLERHLMGELSDLVAKYYGREKTKQ